MLVVSGVCLLATVYFIFITYIKQDGESPATQISGYLFGMSEVTLPPLPDMEKRSKLFQEEKFQALKNFSSLPVENGLVGRQNPFEELIYPTTTETIKK